MPAAIKVENLSKAYQLGEIGTGTISRDLERWYARIRGKEDPFLRIGETNDRSKKGTSDIVWSLKDLNFEIEQGDAVGIIGRNGAGKSTLLKILSKVTAPTSGKITGKGRIASLLEVGTGFHPELSGRENIFLNGAILGMRKHEIKRKLEEIVDFAGIERYLDTPVKRYSSGMYVRLAFAVAAHLESEILIVDEVLAVGDAEFQKKCLGKMGEVSKGEGRTVLFVSHNMDSVMNLCNRGMLLSNGTLTSFSKVEDCIQFYLKGGFNKTSNAWIAPKTSNLPYIEKVKVDLRDEEGNTILLISTTIKSINNQPNAFIAFDIKNGMGNTIMQALPTLETFINCNNSEEHFNFEVKLPGLIPDTYSISVWIGAHNDQTYDWQQDILNFEIITSPTKGRNFPHNHSSGSIVPESKIIY